MRYIAPMLTVAQLIVDRFSADPSRVLFYAPKAQVIPGTEPTGPAKPAPDGWVAYDAATCLDQLSGFAKRLSSLGVARGSTVAIIGDTCHAWAAVDLANQCLGATTIGVYPSLLGPDAGPDGQCVRQRPRACNCGCVRCSISCPDVVILQHDPLVRIDA